MAKHYANEIMQRSDQYRQVMFWLNRSPVVSAEFTETKREIDSSPHMRTNSSRPLTYGSSVSSSLMLRQRPLLANTGESDEPPSHARKRRLPS